MTGDEILKGGKHAGKTWKQILEADRGYIEYMATAETRDEKYRQSDDARRALCKRLLEGGEVSAPSPAPTGSAPQGEEKIDKALSMLETLIIGLDKVAEQTKAWE